MKKIRVYKMPKGTLKAEFLALLKEAGCEIVDDTGEECLIVVLDLDLLEDEGLEEVLLEATGKKCRIIGVWPKGATSGKTPECFEDYRADTVIWDPARLREAVTGERPHHDAPTGETISYPRTRRNDC